MDYKQLGNTGLLVSRLCLGTMTFGDGGWVYDHVGAVSQPDADLLVGAALEAGVNFFDTADVYSNGQSESRLGQAIRNVGVAREDVVIATKVYMRMGQGRNSVGLSRGHIMAAAEASLKRLGLDHIDLYQVHQSDSVTPIDETLRALDDLVTQGKGGTPAAPTGRRGRSPRPMASRSGAISPGSRRCRPITRSPGATWNAR